MTLLLLNASILEHNTSLQLLVGWIRIGPKSSALCALTPKGTSYTAKQSKKPGQSWATRKTSHTTYQLKIKESIVQKKNVDRTCCISRCLCILLLFYCKCCVSLYDRWWTRRSEEIFKTFKTIWIGHNSDSLLLGEILNYNPYEYLGWLDQNAKIVTMLCQKLIANYTVGTSWVF